MKNTSYLRIIPLAALFFVFRFVYGAEVTSLPSEAERTMSNFNSYIRIFRTGNGGKYPDSTIELAQFLFKKGTGDVKSLTELLANKDDPKIKGVPEGTVTTEVVGARPNGEEISSPKPKGTEDIVALSRTYYLSSSKDKSTPKGFYVVLRDNGVKETIPFDLVYFNQIGDVYTEAFPSQPGIRTMETLSYEEIETNAKQDFPGIGKPAAHDTTIVEDNQGPEALVQLSRRINYHNGYGFDRADLWKTFDPAQSEFTLADIEVGATKLGLETQVQKLPLSQLQKSGSPALLFLKDDGRIVTLTALDADRAVVIDRGLTRNVERSVLERRYSGEALVLTKALTQNAGIVADGAVRSVQLPSLDAEVPQQFMLHNKGKTPLTLQLEYPLLSVTDSKLSKDTLAPGETAMLDLKVKWRSILRAPTQNVLVSIHTSDPIVPRLQLAILLNPPKTADAK